MKTANIMLMSMTLIVCLSIGQSPIIPGSVVTGSTRTILAFGTIMNFKMIRKYVTAYGFSTFSDETADFIADHFDLLDAHYSEQSISGFRRMKSRNPEIIIIVYRNAMGMYPSNRLENPDWDIVNQHEDWFIHDKNGNRVENRYWGWYLMDIGNDEWRNYYADQCERMLQEQSIDGIFADDVWDNLPCGDYPDQWWNPWTIPNSWIDKSIGECWHSDMMAFVSYVKQRIGNKLLIVNSVNNDDYVNVCDGKMEEQFVHPAWYSYTEFHDDYINWTKKVDAVKQVSRNGKYVLVDSGFSELSQSPPPSQEKIDKMLMYCFSSYLLALDGYNAAFNFGSFWNTDGSFGYYPIFDESKALGCPVNDHYSYQSVYARDFEEGKVLVNPSDSSYTVSLGQSYETLDEQIVSSVTLGHHTGVILFKS